MADSPWVDGKRRDLEEGRWLEVVQFDTGGDEPEWLARIHRTARRIEWSEWNASELAAKSSGTREAQRRGLLPLPGGNGDV